MSRKCLVCVKRCAICGADSVGEGVAVVWSQVHRSLWLHRWRWSQGTVSGLHPVHWLCLAADTAVPDCVPVQWAIPAGATRPRLLMSVWHVHRQLRERSHRPSVSRHNTWWKNTIELFCLLGGLLMYKAPEFYIRVPRWQPHRRSGLATLPSVGAAP